MKHIATTISETSVWMRYANNIDEDEATEWLEFQVPLKPLTLPTQGGDVPLGEPELQFLAEVRQAALRYVRELIGAETQRLAALAK